MKATISYANIFYWPLLTSILRQSFSMTAAISNNVDIVFLLDIFSSWGRAGSMTAAVSDSDSS
jgi:hypothetical protein